MKPESHSDANQDTIHTIKAILKLTNNGEHPVTYSDLAVELGVSPRSLGAPLDSVQKECAREQYPCLSAMVGYKNNDLMPGDGFYISFAQHYQKQPNICPDDISKIRKAVRKANWKSFLERIEPYSASK